MNYPQESRTAIFYLKRIVGAVLLVALAATFFFSAYSKIHSENAFDAFQWTFLDLGVSNVIVAGVMARVMIGFELMLGLFLLAHIYLRQFTYKAVIGVLLFFIVYLIVVIVKQGNAGDCGCFGDKLAMTPLQAIVKNVIMILVTLVLMYLYPIKPYKYQEYATMLACLIAFSAPFVLNNLYIGTHPVKYSEELNLDLLYKYDDKPQQDLRKGKHIIAFMSLTCPHCKKAAYLLHVIHREHPDVPIFMVLDGSEQFRKAFFDETHAIDVPYLLYPHTEDFSKMAGPSVPAILWVNNGVAEMKSKYAYYQLDPAYMIQWSGRGK